MLIEDRKRYLSEFVDIPLVETIFYFHFTLKSCIFARMETIIQVRMTRRWMMREFNIRKLLSTMLISVGIVFLLTKSSLFKLCDSLSIVGALTIVYSFTFIHTLLGQNASRSGNPLNAYKRVTADMRYNIREEKGYIPETLLVGIAELLLGLFLSFR